MAKDKYSFTRLLFIIEAAAEYFISLIVTGAYLARLTGILGMSDGMTAILSNFVSLGCGFQMVSIFMFRKKSVKKGVTWLLVITQLLFMMLYVVPFFDISSGAKTALFMTFVLLAYFIKNVAEAPKINMYMAAVPDKQRGIFTSIKEMVSLIGGTIFVNIMGRFVDHYDEIGQTETSLVICGTVIFVLMIIHTITLVLAKEKTFEKPDTEVKNNSLIEFKHLILNKKIMLVIGVNTLWSISNAISLPFNGTFVIHELNFDMKFIAMVTALYTVVRIPVSFVLARIADKTTFSKMLIICFIIKLLSFAFKVFTVPANGKVFYTIYHLLDAAAMGGINSAQINLIYDYVAPENRKNALALKQTIYGFVGFFTTLAITPFFNFMQKCDMVVMGHKFYAQNILAFISLLIVVANIIYVKKVVLKLKPYTPEG